MLVVIVWVAAWLTMGVGIPVLIVATANRQEKASLARRARIREAYRAQMLAALRERDFSS